MKKPTFYRYAHERFTGWCHKETLRKLDGTPVTRIRVGSEYLIRDVETGEWVKVKVTGKD